MSEASTLRGKPYIRVAEYGDGMPWIMIEVDNQAFPVLQGGFAGFDLKPGTSYDDAKKIVAFLREHLTDFTVTIFHNAPSSPRVQ